MLKPTYHYKTNLLHYWGKAQKSDDAACGYIWHPTIYHCLDCAAVAKIWIANCPGIKRALLVDDVYRWILFFIYMHDFGKIDTRFVEIIPSLWNFLLPHHVDGTICTVAGAYKHGTYGAKLFSDIYEVCEWMDNAGEHHDRRNNNGKNYSQSKAKDGSELDLSEKACREEFIAIGIDLFFDGNEPSFGWEDVPKVPAAFEGFCTVCDWIASNAEFFPFCNEEKTPRDYFDERCKLALDALRKCGLIEGAVENFGMEGLFPSYEPRGVQKIKVTPKSGSLILIEAPTGEGKTEAALSIASEFVASGEADSIIFALPTQATANSMFERLEATAKRMYPNGSNIVLAHGKSRFNEGFSSLCRTDIQDKNEGALQCSQWLSVSKKRAFLGQIGVCTIDQVLLGVLPIRHNFVRTFAVGRSILIIDEVHAYDSYMNALLDAVLTKHGQCSGSAVLLSATLPSSRKKEIIKIWSKAECDVTSDAYPLATVVNRNDKSCCELIPDDEPKSKTVYLESRRFADMRIDDTLLDEIIECAKNGFTAAVICNLVSDAQGVWERLKAKSQGIRVELFHSRYTFKDRDRIEKSVVEHYGKNRKCGEGSVIVSTQVIEQSLDLDFDFMVTQICPIEILFQRLGRLYRHERKPRPYEIPHCIVISPESDDFMLHGLIYGNSAHLWRARELVEGNMNPVFPGVYRSWIELSHSKFDNEPESISKSEENYRTDEDGKRYTAHSIIRMSKDDLTECRAELLTRDSEMSISILPIDKDGCLLDENKTTLESLKKGDKNLGANETVQLQYIPCPATWREGFTDEKREDGYILPTVNGDARSWTYKCKSGNTVLFYSSEEGLRKERCS